MRSTIGVVLIAATLPSAACHTMRPVALEQLGAMRPSRVWVTRADHSVVVVEGPRVLESALVGFVGGTYEEMPTDAVTTLRVKERARGKTVALIAASMIGAATFAYLVANASSYQDPSVNLDCDDNPDQPGCPGVGPGPE